mmetsp:Transcript_98969/g.206279  ORF Transcript_98969/g.206279 Transcript_98969/m.206279 type:complete len:292 (+) Transcript_98969:1279-2154(+)
MANAWPLRGGHLRHRTQQGHVQSWREEGCDAGSQDPRAGLQRGSEVGSDRMVRYLRPSASTGQEEGRRGGIRLGLRLRCGDRRVLRNKLRQLCASRNLARRDSLRGSGATTGDGHLPRRRAAPPRPGPRALRPRRAFQHRHLGRLGLVWQTAGRQDCRESLAARRSFAPASIGLQLPYCARSLVAASSQGRLGLPYVQLQEPRRGARLLAMPCCEAEERNSTAKRRRPTTRGSRNLDRGLFQGAGPGIESSCLCLRSRTVVRGLSGCEASYPSPRQDAQRLRKDQDRNFGQ